MWKFLSDIVQKTLSGFGERLAAFGPNLLAMALIVLAGLLLAGLVRLGLRFLLPRLGFDRLAQRTGLATMLQKGGIAAPPSRVLAVGAAWAVVAVFVLLGIGALNLPFATGP